MRTAGFALVGGGARSGKSAFAQRLAEGRFGSEARVRRDRDQAVRRRNATADRLRTWASETGAFDTVEGSARSGDHAIARLAETSVDVVLVDCLTLWLSNLLLDGVSGTEIELRVGALAASLACAPFESIVVSNEVGMGLVPETPLGRGRFRDVAGRAHQRLAREARGDLLRGDGDDLAPQAGAVAIAEDGDHAVKAALALVLTAYSQSMPGALGEPPDALHPVAWMGTLIARAKAWALRGSRLSQLARGAAIALVLPVFFAACAWAILACAARPVPLAELAAGVLLLKPMFAVRALRDAAFAVRDALDRDDVPAARRALGSLCSRRADALSAEELAMATIESVAENASDSFVAPLFFFVAGVPGRGLLPGREHARRDGRLPRAAGVRGEGVGAARRSPELRAGADHGAPPPRRGGARGEERRRRGAGPPARCGADGEPERGVADGDDGRAPRRAAREGRSLHSRRRATSARLRGHHRGLAHRQPIASALLRPALAGLRARSGPWKVLAVRPAIAHGGLVASELEALGLLDSDVLDVSVNVNPYGPCAAVREAIAAADLQRYPDPTATPARRALAAWLGVAEGRVVVGNGAVDLLWTLARTCLREGDTVLTIEPTFSEMRAAAARVGARLEEHRTEPAKDFAIDPAALDAAIERLRPRLVYACSPSNPVGHCVSAAFFAGLAERHPETLFVIDVSFLSLSTRHAETPWRGSERVVWLLSLTKDHGLAGLRIGCAIAPPAIAKRIEEGRPPWSVSAPAQAAAVAITSEAAAQFVATSRARLLDDCVLLQRALRRLVVAVHDSDTVFVLADLGAARTATNIRARLLREHRVLVRDATSFGLPHHVRVAARPAGEQDRVVSAFAQVLGE